MRVPLRYFPADIIQKYGLNKLVHTNGYVYIKIIKAMYGLKQAAVLAYKNMSTFLTDAGYTLTVNSFGMWKHKTRRKIFNLCVDDFGVKYYSKDDVQHLINAIQKQYTCKVD